MTLDPWKVLERRSLLAVDPWLEVVCEQVQLPGGRIVNDYYSVRLPDFVAVIALASDERVILERHYRHGARNVIFTVPAGYLNDRENSFEAARRELLEETGYQSERWSSLGSYVVDSNRGCGTAHFFMAQDCTRQCTPCSDDLEETELHLIPFSEACNLLDSGRGASICLVAALGLAYRRLRCDSDTRIGITPAR